MAVDTQTFRLLLAARKAGVDFSRTVTFGRQSFFPKPRLAARALAASGLNLDLARFGPLRHAYAETCLTALGAATVDSMDASDYEYATIVHDLNQPVPDKLRGRYTLVFDGGTTEHVFNYPQALANAIRLLAVGGHFISITSGNNQHGHGFYQFSAELFYRVFSPANGFATRAVLLADARPGGRFYRVADPAAIHHRIEFTSTRPLLVAVITRKMEAVDGMRLTPQQSDYQTLWRENSGSTGRPADRLRRELRRVGRQVQSFAGRHFHLPWQCPGITALSDAGLYALDGESS